MTAAPLITLRLATAADIPDLAAIFAHAIRAIAPQQYTREQVQAWAAFPSLNRHSFQCFILDATTYVASVDGRLVGFAGIADDGHITALYVHGDYGRRGIGSRLMAAVLEHGRSHSIPRLYSEASEFSKGVFEKFGFRLYDTEQVERNGVWFSRYLMECDLEVCPEV